MTAAPKPTPTTEAPSGGLALTEAERAWIGRIVRRLPSHDPIRQGAEAVLRNEETTPEAVSAALATVAPRARAGWRARAAALWLLGRVPLSDTERAQAIQAMRLAEHAPVAATGRRFALPALVAIALGAVGVLVVITSILLGSDALAKLGVISFMLSPLAAVAAYLLLWTGDRVQPRDERRAAIRSLGRLADVASIPSLALTACDIAAGDMPRLAAESVRSIACALGPEHADLVPPQATGELARALSRYATVPNADAEAVAMAILDALQCVGAGSAVAAVERARWVAWSQAVRQKAGEVLPVLEERLRQARAAEHLLRPSSAPGAELLLRPAASAPEVDASLLLRPVEGDGEAGP